MTGMHVLVDITHPAHVHFYRHAMEIWRGRGHRVTITSRGKDVVSALLEKYGLDHLNLGPARKGPAGLALELVQRNFRLIRLIRRLGPDVLTGIGGIFAAQSGRLLGKPAVVFTDTEKARLSNALTFPFAAAVVTPDCFAAPVKPRHRHIKYAGYHELAYTHQRRFKPDPEVPGLFGIKPEEKFVILRSVNWGASHDVGQRGFTGLAEVVGRIERHAKVLISAEGGLPPELESRRLTEAPHLVLHLQYYADLYIGEGATMASECACLGTPAIFVSTISAGTIEEQNQRYGLVFPFDDQERATAKAVEILTGPEPRQAWREKGLRLQKEKIDVTEFTADLVERFGGQG